MSDTITSTEYCAEINSLAEEAVRMCRSGEIADREALHDWTHKTIDGHQWVIYTAYNFQVLAVSENDGAYLENFGADGLVTENGALNTAVLAYGAMEADLSEALCRFDDFDANDDDEWREVAA